MKKVYLLLTAICLAALTGCIKEEDLSLEHVTLAVSLDTRGADDSVEQGDGIKDVMMWAFKCSLDATTGLPTNVESTATGWRYVPDVNTYQSVNVHVPLEACTADPENYKQSYVLVAVINTESFGETIEFNNQTTFDALQKATFDASSTLFMSYLPDDEDKTPEFMPVSNWATFTVDATNTHDSDCYALTLPVYRAVGKTQLFMRKSNADFNLTVTNAEVVSSAALAEGFILTANSVARTDTVADEVAQVGYAGEDVTTPSWYANPTTAPTTIPMWNSANITIGENDTEIAVNDEFNPTDVEATATDVDEEGKPAYTWVASAFLHENANALTATTNYETTPTGNGGYYMAITYQIEGETGTTTRYVPLPAVVRNHDYQVLATVEKNVTGNIVINYLVTEWTEQSINVPSFN